MPSRQRASVSFPPPRTPEPRDGRPAPVVTRSQPSRVAMLAVHTSPLAQPGTGDAGGLNVYVVETARRLAERGVDVEVFTRATSSTLPPTVELAPGVLVRHITAGPFEGLDKEDLPGQLCAFASGVMRTAAARPAGHYDLVHSHYWLSGQVGWLAADRWQVPLVHTMHTMARVKNLALADGDTPEPSGREIGEQQVVDAADRLVANTADEADQLVSLYGAAATRSASCTPASTSIASRRAAASSGCGPRRARRPARRPAAALRRAHPAPQGARTCCCGPPPSCSSASRPALAARRRRRRRPERLGAARARVAHAAGPPARHLRRRPVRAAGQPPTGSRRGTAQPTSSRCRRTASRSGWWPWRPRPAARPWSRPTSAGCATPSPTGAAGCSCPATRRGRGRTGWRCCCATTRGAPPWPQVRSSTPPSTAGTHGRRPARRLPRRSDRARRRVTPVDVLGGDAVAARVGS